MEVSGRHLLPREVGQVSLEAVEPGLAGTLNGPTSARWLREGDGLRG